MTVANAKKYIYTGGFNALYKHHDTERTVNSS